MASLATTGQCNQSTQHPLPSSQRKCKLCHRVVNRDTNFCHRDDRSESQYCSDVCFDAAAIETNTDRGLSVAPERAAVFKATSNRRGASKRKSYSFDEKVRLVREFKKKPGSTYESFMKHVNKKRKTGEKIPVATFKKWMGDPKVKVGLEASPKNLDSRKKTTQVQYPEVEDKLEMYMRAVFDRCDKEGISLPRGLLKKKAVEYADNLLDEERRKKFRVSNGWIERFLRRKRLGKYAGKDNGINEWDEVSALTKRVEILEQQVLANSSKLDSILRLLQETS